MGHSHSSNSPQRDLIPYLYTGKYQTSLSGLIDMDARWYNPQVGRFIQPDYYNLAELALPNGARNKLLATTSLNSQMLLNDPSQQMRYGYVSGNPMRWVDPMGLAEITDHLIYSREVNFQDGFSFGPGLKDQWNVAGLREDDEKSYNYFFEDRFPNTVQGAKALLKERIENKIENSEK